jgi:hypothetical protein
LSPEGLAGSRKALAGEKITSVREKSKIENGSESSGGRIRCLEREGAEGEG